MTEPVSWLLIEPGWAVVTSEGDQVGTVQEILGDDEAGIFDGLAVARGLLKRSQYVPAESVAEITEGRVRLAIAADVFERLDEHQPQ